MNNWFCYLCTVRVLQPFNNLSPGRPNLMMVQFPKAMFLVNRRKNYLPSSFYYFYSYEMYNKKALSLFISGPGNTNNVLFLTHFSIVSYSQSIMQVQQFKISFLSQDYKHWLVLTHYLKKLLKLVYFPTYLKNYWLSL